VCEQGTGKGLITYKIKWTAPNLKYNLIPVTKTTPNKVVFFVA
jgi:hypothetical protein